MKEWLNILISIKVIQPIDRMQDKYHIITSLDKEMTFDTIQHPFMVKVLETPGIKWKTSDISQYNKAMSSNSTANISPNGEKPTAFSLIRINAVFFPVFIPT